MIVFFAIGILFSLSSTFINQVRFSFSRVAAGVLHENMGNSLNRAVGLPELSANPRDFGLSFITISDFSPIGDEYNNPQHSVSNVFQVTDTATYSSGKHLFSFGIDFRALQQNAFRDVQSRGFLTFSDFGQISSNGLADLPRLSTATGQLRLVDALRPPGEEGGVVVRVVHRGTEEREIRVDVLGNLAIGFSASNLAIHPGAYYALREAGDPPGTVQPAMPLADGVDCYRRTFGTGRKARGGTSKSRRADCTGTLRRMLRSICVPSSADMSPSSSTV